MTRGRLPLLACLVAGLVAVVALVAHGRPLAASAGRGGLPMSFWDLLVTSAVILAALFVLALVVGVFATPRVKGRRPPVDNRQLWRYLTGVLLFTLAAVALRHHIHFHFHGPRYKQGRHKVVGHFRWHQQKAPTGQTQLHLVWEEIVAVAGLILVAAAVLVSRLNRSRVGDLPLLTAPEAVATALDESLDDLRTDPDLRRAIIAAYARMERALAGAGVPRRPSEAPLEYLSRSLLELDVDGPAIRRLTELFEWARFSHHDPKAPMRDEAVDALVAIRDSLRAPAKAAA